MSLFNILYDAGPNGLWIFLLLTVVIGGGAAFVSGQAIAETWRPFWQVIGYGLLLALVVRFLHFALFEEVLLSLRNYIVDAGVLLVLAVIGYLQARSRQMATQYNWLGK
jgi:hypothetical protein